MAMVTVIVAFAYTSITIDSETLGSGIFMARVGSVVL